MINPRRGGDGGGVQRPSEPRLSNPNPPEPQPDAIATLRSWEPPEKLEVRRKLNNCAVLAAARATSAQSPDARQQFWLANVVAARWTFATADIEALHDVLDGLRRTFCGADAFERNGSGL